MSMRILPSISVSLRALTRVLVLGAALAPQLAAVSGAPDSTTPADADAAGAERAGFLASETVVALDRGQVVPVRVEAAATVDRVLRTESADPSVLRVLRPARILAGERIGYARVRGAGLGTTELLIEGIDAPLRVSVEALRGEAAVHNLQPTIVLPAPDAVVWGVITVAVETHMGSSILGGARAKASVIVRLPDGSVLEPDGILPADGGPTERSVFSLDLTGVEAGPFELGVEARVGDGETIVGDPVWVTVVHPDTSDVFVAECETFRWVARPEAFGEEEPRAGRSADASGGGFVVNSRPDPVWIVPVEVERDGSYQAMLVARGDVGAGALPSVGLVVDGPYEPRVSTRLPDRRWRRVPLGPPFQLEAGPRMIGLRYLNDGPTSQLSDRALYLDRFELLRLDTLTAADDAMSDGDDMMGAATMMGMSMDDMVPDSSPGDAWLAAGPEGIRVALDAPVDGLPVNGRVNLVGRCVWNGASNDGPAPKVDLYIDGQPVATQQAARPIFAFDRGSLDEGEHSVQLVAWLPDGRSASTPPQTLIVDGRAEPETARRFRRFSVLDQRWVEQFAGSLIVEGGTPGHRVVRLDQGVQGEIELPKRLVGNFDLLVEVRGSEQASATLELVHVTEDGERVVATHDVIGWWNYVEVGTLELSAGPDLLRVRVSDAQRKPSDNADANRVEPVLRSVILRERRERPDRNPPRAEILYPQDGHLAAGVDAVVVHAFDEGDRLRSADVLIDGVAQRTFGHVPDGVGHLVLPLLLRDVAPGEHTLAVRVVDMAGNMAESSEIAIQVEAEGASSASPRGPYARAVHLLDRFAFGPEPQELARVLVEGETQWLAQRLSESGAGDEVALDAARSRLLSPGEYNVRFSTLDHLLRTDNAVRARFTLWLENHFSTWMRKASPGPEWREYQALHAIGPVAFGELLLTSATSPAMLWYLDQSASFASRLNENYAREIMELHSVGVDGGYTQDEVTALARLLCGMTVSEEAPLSGRGNALTREFRFAADLCDGTPVDILGMRFDRPPRDGAYDRVLEAIELLAAHPSTARYVSRELAEHYVAVPAPDDLVDDLEQVFHASGGDLFDMLLALSQHPRFWEAPERVTTPIDFGLRLGRAIQNPGAIWALHAFLNRSGMAFFDRATPDGYPEEDAAWVDSNATAQRWRLGGEIPWAIRALVPDDLRRVHDGDPDRWRQRVVDVAAVRLTGRVLGPESNAAALEFLRESEGSPWEIVDRLAVLVTRLPEASLR